jgi:hypothetical protein
MKKKETKVEVTGENVAVNTVVNEKGVKGDVVPVLTSSRVSIDALSIGLANIHRLPSTPKPYSGSTLDTGFIAFTRRDSELRLTIAYGRLMPQHIPLPQFIELIEHADETLLLQNCKELDQRFGSSSRGQLLATLCKKRSSLIFVHGVVGKVVRSEKDIAKRGEYFIDRSILQAFYIAVKNQAVYQAELESLLNSNDGWLEYQIQDLCS